MCVAIFFFHVHIGYADQDKPSVFEEVLRPRFDYKNTEKRALQVEIHVFISPTDIKASILLNKLRLVGILDLILELKTFVVDKLEEEEEEEGRRGGEEVLWRRRGGGGGGGGGGRGGRRGEEEEGGRGVVVGRRGPASTATMSMFFTKSFYQGRVRAHSSSESRPFISHVQKVEEQPFRRCSSG